MNTGTDIEDIDTESATEKTEIQKKAERYDKLITVLASELKK